MMRIALLDAILMAEGYNGIKAVIDPEWENL
jgi:hypothetical protein